MKSRKGKLTNHILRDVAAELHSFCLQSIKLSVFVLLRHPLVCLEQERLDTEQVEMLTRNRGKLCQEHIPGVRL